jgi:hypothetical protein
MLFLSTGLVVIGIVSGSKPAPAAVHCPKAPAEMSLLLNNAIVPAGAKPVATKRIHFAASLSDSQMDGVRDWFSASEKAKAQDKLWPLVKESRDAWKANRLLVVCSNLVDSVAAAYSAFSGLAPVRKVSMISALQDIVSVGMLGGEKGVVVPADIKDAVSVRHAHIAISASDFHKFFETSGTQGSINGRRTDPARADADHKRFTRFCQWLALRDEKDVLVFGHSTWLKQFAKKLKFVNPLTPNDKGIFTFDLKILQEQGCTEMTHVPV